MSAISWDTVEDAIQAWVSGSSGIPGARCIWTYQGGPIPEYPYIALEIDAVRGVGQPWKKRIDHTDPVAGGELRELVRQHQMGTLTLQCFCDAKTGSQPLRIIVDVMSSIDLYEYEIDEGGAGVGDASPAQFIKPGGGGILQPRAVATLQLHFTSEMEKRETYVERWKATVNVTDVAGDVVGSIPFWQPQTMAFSSGFSRGFDVVEGVYDNG